MSNIRAIGKFLDQPILVSKFQKAVPALLTTGAVAYTIYDASKEKNKEKRKQRALKTGITLGVTVASALAAPKIASSITKRPLTKSLDVMTFFICVVFNVDRTFAIPDVWFIIAGTRS